MMSQAGKQVITTNKLSNTPVAVIRISSLVSAQNITGIFPEQSYIKHGGETSPRPFSKKIKIKHILGLIF